MASPLVFVLNGPNLNMLGTREPAIYGTRTLAEIEAMCAEEAASLGLAVDCRQSNHESALVDWVQEAASRTVGVVLNAGAYARTSVALRDAVAAVAVPVIEVHIGNIFNKEPIRPPSLLSPVAAGLIGGLGVDVYLLALQALARRVNAAG